MGGIHLISERSEVSWAFNLLKIVGDSQGFARESHHDQQFPKLRANLLLSPAGPPEDS